MLRNYNIRYFFLNCIFICLDKRRDRFQDKDSNIISLHN